MTYTIDAFWALRLADAAPVSAPLIRGWQNVRRGLPTFHEAPITLSEEFGDVPTPPSTAPLILVSAPGAVGKSTLARQIAYRTGSVYVDLAATGPVGENTLSGGLLQSGLLDGWSEATVALLIDGLDEARLRVTGEAFESFLRDVARLSSDRPLPTVLFGRTGAIEYAWLVLAEELAPPVLEISYYDEQASLSFAKARLQHTSATPAHLPVQFQAVELLLSQLRQQTENDGDSFAGYAPVLLAVADRVAKERNPSALLSAIQRGHQSVTLQSVVNAILDREQTKLESLPLEDPGLLKRLYLPSEQLGRLVGETYGTAPPAPVAKMSNRDAKTYEQALKSWVPEHPFLSGGSTSPSFVFEAAIAAHALSHPASAEAVLRHELDRGAAANPFLYVFYPKRAAGSHVTHLPPEHIGIVYASVRARLALGEAATLFVGESGTSTTEDEIETAVEIVHIRNGQERVLLECTSDQLGVLHVGSHLADVDIALPHGEVQIGMGKEVTLVAPISIESAQLALNAAHLVIEAPTRGGDAVVLLRTAQFHSKTLPVLLVRDNVDFVASWPGARGYPWTSFATDIHEPDDTQVREGLRRLRKFVTAFRAHGREQLGRYRAKIESPRMIKGTGGAVLDALLRERILSLDGKWYILNTDILGGRLGVHYVDCHAYRFGPAAVEFVEQAVNRE